ncbi:MAG: serine/threonine protein kinase [Acidobacteriaceae bacterium]|nr:serine/threonine protein kinase [Acidobacteriaceae bacterium]
MIDLAQGARAINSKLIHRDIKPDNILIEGKTLKIGDFGISKFVDESTRLQTFKGGQHIAYMAPEGWLNQANTFKLAKRRGEWAELQFMACASEQGLQVSKPWGEMALMTLRWKYEGHFVRVQVKSTIFKDRGGYSCSVRDSKGPYLGDPFDFLAAYVVPEDLWYIIPAKKFKMQGSIALYPNLKKSKYGAYKEAWRLLRGKSRAGMVARIEACAESLVESKCIDPSVGFPYATLHERPPSRGSEEDSPRPKRSLNGGTLKSKK